jgi:hypothetical protein
LAAKSSAIFCLTLANISSPTFAAASHLRIAAGSTRDTYLLPSALLVFVTNHVLGNISAKGISGCEFLPGELPIARQKPVDVNLVAFGWGAFLNDTKCPEPVLIVSPSFSLKICLTGRPCLRPFSMFSNFVSTYMTYFPEPTQSIS